MKDRRLLLGLLSPVISFSFIALAIAIHPWFSWTENALSDLGALHTENGWVFSLGLLLGGTFSMAFSTYLIEVRRGSAELIGSISFFLSSLSMSLIGIFPEDTGPHWKVSVLFYLLSAVAMLIYGIHMSVKREWQGYLTLGLLIAAILLMFLPGWTSLAIPETIGAVAIASWVYLMIYGIEKGGMKRTTGTT